MTSPVSELVDLLALERNVRAVWTAIEQAVATRDFRPSPSKLCGWCHHKPHCPAFGGEAPEYPGWPGSAAD